MTAWAVSVGVNAQTFRHYTTTDTQPWQESKVALSGKATAAPLLTVTGQEKGHEFKAWGTEERDSVIWVKESAICIQASCGFLRNFAA